ncbi:hypothetical protein GPECTOR_2133g1113 [Gonium pectorale]|uniref:Uncharacterized protein n=1 Tax=Gonium pectorale TaxID=33097 RepID=A0A150FTA9_GONPE|nr:hypothetical protein GPECTOR_2133g1113 [Gonium pectorale]|eukprot:KXZ40818.1 hypothetical protein GPECTOR_2133g1113 [Gonium pectorale]
MAAAMPHAAAAAAAAAADRDGSSGSDDASYASLYGGGAAELFAAAAEAAGPASSSSFPSSSTASPAAALGSSPLTVARVRVHGGQLVALAYSLARYPPPRPPPAGWMRLLLQCLESELGGLGASECAALCVALMRLGAAPGGDWLARLGAQVELSRALTERADHALLSEAWLGLRRALGSRRGQQRA